MSETCPRCHQEVPAEQPTEYSVLYCGHRNDTWRNLPFGTQHRTVKALGHFDAVCKGANNSQHSTGATYLVIGEAKHKPFHVGPVACLFEITRVEGEGEYDFTSFTPSAALGYRHGKYRVHEVTINGEAR